MYEEYLRALLAYIVALNSVTAEVEEKDGMTPYLHSVPLCMEGDLVGFLRDEIGGAWSYHEATEAERVWWAAKPR